LTQFKGREVLTQFKEIAAHPFPVIFLDASAKYNAIPALSSHMLVEHIKSIIKNSILAIVL